MAEQERTITVERNDEEGRYEIFSDGESAGTAAFELAEGNRIVFTHTVLDRAFRGQGIGRALASEALADAARRGETIVPECPFIADYLKGHEVAGAVVDWPEPSDGEDAATPGESPA